VVIDVGGVGYLVQVSAPTMAFLGEPGDEALVLVHTLVREDAITLFGFSEPDERDVFLMLLGVQGVGPRLALSILSELPPVQALAAIAGDDRRALCAADGVGPKLAARIVSELADKAVAAGARPAEGTARGPGPGAGSPAAEEARQALIHLGFQRLETSQMLAAVMAQRDPPADTASIVSACLRAANTRTA
jgi:Holliday junction DNA helicase RuvA